MCERGNTVPIHVRVGADLSPTGKARYRAYGIDKCISGIVKALVDAGFHTRGSCCGHGVETGFISFDDQPFMLIIAGYPDETFGSKGWRPKPVRLVKTDQKTMSKPRKRK